MSDTKERTLIGYMYIARRPCGKASALCWDDAGHARSIAKTVSEYIKRGDSVTREARYKGDELPEMICKPGCRDCFESEKEPS